MTPQRVFANTNSIAQHEVDNEPLPLAGGGGGGGVGTMSPPFRVGINRGQKIP